MDAGWIKSFWKTLGAIWLLFPCAASADVHSHLQWFDSRGEIMDLDWATAVQWTWGPDKTPIAQVLITVPEQLHLTVVDEAQAKFQNSVPGPEGKNTSRTLVINMESARKTVQLKKLDLDSDTKEIGLTVILNTTTPNLIVSDSCERNGVHLEAREDRANFLFLAASCKMISTGLRISLETSHDALLAHDADEVADHHFVTNPLTLLLSKRNLAQMKKNAVAATVRVEGEASPSLTTQFDLIYNHDAEIEAVVGVTPDVQLTQPATSDAKIPNKPWLFSGELNLGYYGYLQARRSRGLNPSEFNLGGKISSEHEIGSHGARFKADLSVPLVTLMPDAHFPASGDYTAQTRASFNLFDRGKIALYLEPGIEGTGEHLHDRSDVNGIYAGPVLAALLRGTLSGFGNRELRAFAEASPLAGGHATPYFQSWDWSGELSLEMIKIDAEKHWDLLLRYRGVNIHAPSLPAAKSSETTFGVRMGF